MLSNNLRLSFICLIINFIDAGLLAQMGLLTDPIATAFSVSITSAAAQFSMLTGGILAGSIIAYFLMDHLGERLVILGSTIIIVFSTIALYFINSIVFLSVLFGLIGVAQGVNVVIAGLIISKVWTGKNREAFFIGQDASFNLGGLFFPFITTYILSRHMPWELCYIFAVAFSVFIIYLLVTSNFSFAGSSQNDSDKAQNVEWNSGIILAGVALFFIIVGKYIIILWLPQYAETALSLDADQSSLIISTIFSTALIGTVVGVYIITKIQLVYFMCIAILIGFLSSLLFIFASNYSLMLVVAAIFGLAVSVLFNVFIVYGLSFTIKPSHKHISYILFCGGVGATIAPYISSVIVERFDDAASALQTSSALYGITFLLVIGYELFGIKAKNEYAKV